MNSMKRINCVISLSLAVLFVWSLPALAGVPSPIPSATDEREVLIANIGDFQFESGAVVRDFKVTYVTHGKLNEKKDNSFW
jgi:homoserine O-acetyltransferase